MLFVLLFLVALVSNSGNGASSSNGITKSTTEREKLDTSMVVQTDYYVDELGWINSSKTLEDGMENFYKETGVQPFLYICNNIDGDASGNYTDAQEQEFGNALYDKLFEDEGHILVVFCEYSSAKYVCFCVVGNSAKTVMDSEAREILLDYIDHYYYSDYEDDEFFALSFEKAGKKIMHVDKSYGWVVWLVVVGIFGAVIIIRRIEKVHDKRIEARQREKEILETPLGQFREDSVEGLAGKYENGE